MQNSIDFGASAVTAVLLALASSVLAGPLLAAAVALLAVGGAWIIACHASRQLRIAALEQRLAGAVGQRRLGA